MYSNIGVGSRARSSSSEIIKWDYDKIDGFVEWSVFILLLSFFDRQGLGAVNENENIQIEPSIIRLMETIEKRKTVILVRCLWYNLHDFPVTPTMTKKAKAVELRYCAWVREDSLWFCEQQNYGFFFLDRTFSINAKGKYISHSWTIVAAEQHSEQQQQRRQSCRVGWQKRFIWLIQRHLA